MKPALWIYPVILLLTAVVLFYLYFARKFAYWKKRNIPYLKPAPFFGNLLPVLAMKTTFAEWLLVACRQMKSDYFGIFFFDQPVLVVQSPKLVKAILQKDFVYFQDRTVASFEKDPIMKNMMFFSRNPHWKSVRTMSSPVFSSGKLKQMFLHVLDEAKRMNDYISKLSNIPNLDSKEICAKYSTNVIARCAFAVTANSFENPDAEFRMSTAMRQLGAWFVPNLMTICNISFFDKQCLAQLKHIFTDVLHSRMQSATLKGTDLVDILLDAGKNKNESDFNEDILLAQAFQFFIAGFETVSSTLSFALYELSIHLEMQNRLRKEIFENISKYNGITYEGVSEMKYLDMCVSETLRKYPVLPFLDRTCKSDYKVEGTNMVIEKGTLIYIPMLGLHYDTKYFPDPEKFDPERFSDKKNINADGFHYVPFGEGPRICIGNRFGLMAVKIGLASILSKFSLEPTDKTPIPVKFATKTFLLQSDVGLPLKFVPI